MNLRAGVSVDKPLLLILHGGPGTPEVLPFRRYDAGLEKDFIVVNWDQRGSGKSASPSMTADSMTIEQILSNAHELVGCLKESFGKEKIYLLGHSWGTILGALLASRYTEDFHAYIGMGQWVSMDDNERLCYEFTRSEAERRGDRKAVALLERIGKPENGLYRGDWLESLRAQRTYLKKYGGFLYDKSGVLDLHFGSYLRTTEYRGFSISSFFKAELFCLRALWPELANVDLSRDAANIATPVFLFHTPPSLAEAWLSGISAPSKGIPWFAEPVTFMAALARISHNEFLMEKAVMQTPGRSGERYRPLKQVPDPSCRPPHGTGIRTSGAASG